MSIHNRIRVSILLLLALIISSVYADDAIYRARVREPVKSILGYGLLLSKDKNNLDSINNMEKIADDFYLKYPEYKNEPNLYLLVAKMLEKYDTDRSIKIYNKIKLWGGIEFREEINMTLFELSLMNKPVIVKFTSTDGKLVDVAAMKGKVILVDFWAAWCQASYVDMPDIVDTYRKYHDKGFEVIGISLDCEREKFEKAVKQRQMTWPQYFDGKGWNNNISSPYRILSIPTLWLIDKDGKLVDMDAEYDLDVKVNNLLQNMPIDSLPSIASDSTAPNQPRTKLNWIN